MVDMRHVCLVSLEGYATNVLKEDNTADQPLCIQKLSDALGAAFSICVSRAKSRSADCPLCQIAPQIDKVTERARHMQINESLWPKMPGAFPCPSDISRCEFKECCDSLRRTLETIIEDDRNRPLPRNAPTGTASAISYNSCDVQSNIAGDSDVETSYQDEGERLVRFENQRKEDATYDLIQNCWISDPSERPTMGQIVESPMMVALSSLPETCPSFTAAPSPLPANHFSLPVTLASLPATTPSFPSTFRSLITSLNESMALSDSSVDTVTLDLICDLLNLPDHDITAADPTTTPDVGLSLEFLLDLLCKNSFANSGVQGANQKARKLLFKLITMTNVIPRSLFITDVRPYQSAFDRGGFAGVYKGEYKGRLVALKVLNKVRNEKSSLQQDFRTEALVWRSISHRFILPLLGIYEEKSFKCLVSPFMSNGTLSQWRTEKRPDIVEIHRVMLEVAEAVQYLHSEGIVHGDLHGNNILLNSDFHCQIIDFGLTRQSDATAVWTTQTITPNYASPEQFGMCSECGELECGKCHQGHRGKTMKTDVYAYGGLYYAIFFDAVPFQGKNLLQIMASLTRGELPERLESPRMEENTWNLIQDCWKSKPSERITMDEIVEMLRIRREVGFMS
ncbi:hypothetical protein AX14_013087 [Amanita brunnescens Koide BX004]|nr:hypothetical protein AX14_013087 [Amanita brunnescens Koide BX004]